MTDRLSQNYTLYLPLSFFLKLIIMLLLCSIFYFELNKSVGRVAKPIQQIILLSQ